MSEDDMIWHNPAPNAAAPMVSTGKQKTVQIAVSALTDMEVRLTAALARLDRMTEAVVKARDWLRIQEKFWAEMNLHEDAAEVCDLADELSLVLGGKDD